MSLGSLGLVQKNLIRTQLTYDTKDHSSRTPLAIKFFRLVQEIYIQIQLNIKSLAIISDHLCSNSTYKVGKTKIVFVDAIIVIKVKK